MAREIKVAFLGDASDLERASKDANNALDRVGRQAGVTAGLVASGIGIAAQALGSLVRTGIGFLAESVKEAEQAQGVAKVTAQLITTTGGAAKVSATHVSDYAEQLSNVTGIDDDLIAQGQNVLLTFKNVRNETGKGNAVFDRATKAGADMAEVMGTDLKAANLQLGKALNDPIKGITALTRVGVTFTEQQQKNIKSLTEQGKTLEAQKIILEELESEFGGAAEAGATSSEKLATAWGNLKEDIGTTLLPAFAQVTDFLITSVFPVLSTFATNAVAAVKGTLETIKGWAGAFVAAVRDAFAGKIDVTSTGFAGAMEVVGNIVGTLGRVISEAVGHIREFGEKAQPVLDALGQWATDHAEVLQVVATSLASFAATFGVIAGSALVMSQAVAGLQSLSSILGLVAAAVAGSTLAVVALVIAAVVALGVGLVLAYQKFQGFRDFVDNTWEAIKDGALAVADFFVGVWNKIQGPAEAAFGAIRDALTSAFQAIAPIVATVAEVLGELVARVGPALQTAADAISNAFGTVADAVDTALTAVQQAAAPVIELLVGLWNQYGDEVSGILAGLRDIAVAVFDRIRDTVEQTVKVLSKVLGPIFDGFIRNVQLLAQLIGPAFTLVRQVVGAAITYLIGVVRVFAQFMGPIWAALWNTAVDVVRNVIGPIRTVIEGMLRVIQGFIDIIAGIFTGDWQRIWDGVVEIFSGVWQQIAGQFQAVVGVITAVFGNLLDVITAPFRGAAAAIPTLIDTVVGGISGAFQGVIAFFTDTWSTLLGLITNPFTTAWDTLTSVIGVAASTVIGWFQPVIDWFADTWAMVEGFITAPFTKAWDFITGIFGTVKQWFIDNVYNPIAGVINTLIRGWNAVEFTMPSFDTHIPGVGEIGGFTVGVPDIAELPKLARGGIARNPMLALIGDVPEAVIPLSQLRRVAGGGPTTIVNHRQTINAGFGTDRFALERAVKQGNHKLNRLAGVRA